MSIGTRLRKVLKLPPRKYQVQAVRFFEENDGCALLADEQGVGKTISLIAYLALHPESRPVLLVVPGSVKVYWQRQLLRFAGIKSQVLEGRTPYRPSSKVLIVNYEILHYWRRVLRNLEPTTVIFDEVHYLAGRTSKRTRAAEYVSSGAPHRIGLSGTPLANRPVDYYPPLHIIRPDLFPTFSEFAWRYCDPRPGYGGRLDFTGHSNLDELHELASEFVLRRLKSEVLKELPPKTRTVIPVDIDNRREYDRVTDDFPGWLEDNSSELTEQELARRSSPLVRLGVQKRLAARGKLKGALAWMNDWLIENDGKLVVFSIHRRIVEAVSKAYGPKCATVSGATPTNRRQKEIDRFVSSKSCRIFNGQLKAAGTGIDGLQHASHTTLTLEIGWNDQVHQQAEDRLNRDGQTTPCDNYYLVGRDTVEERLLEIVQEKKVVVDQVLEGRNTRAKDSLLKMLREAE